MMDTFFINPMNRKRECLQAYFAGIFDGEGTIGIYNTKRQPEFYVLKIAIKMSDLHAVSLMWREYPEGSLFCIKNGFYVFQLHGNKAYRFLKEMKPYCIIKHEQVKIGLSFLVNYRKNQVYKNHKYEKNIDSYRIRCRKLSDLMKEKKNIKYKGVNSVNTLLTHEMREYRSERDEVELDIRIIREHLEGVQTKLSESNKIISAPEKDIVDYENNDEAVLTKYMNLGADRRNVHGVLTFTDTTGV